MNARSDILNLGTQQFAQSRKTVLLSLLWLIFIGTSIVTILNTILGNYIVIILPFVLILASGYMIWRVWHSEDVTKIAPWFLGFFTIIMVGVQFGSSTNYPPFLFIWLFILPPIYTFLLGAKKGLIVSGAVLAVGCFGAYTTGIDQVFPGQTARVVVNISIALITITVLAYYYERHRDFAERSLSALANTDPLTRLFNRHYLINRFEQELARSQRNGSGLSLIMLDLDHFKKINDTYGHIGGDIVLKAVANTLQDTTRKSDVVARMGGEEFIILAPDTDLDGALKLSENIRHKIATLLFPNLSTTPLITASLGVSQTTHQDTNFETLYKRTDGALYQAKNAGRNQVYASDRVSQLQVS